MINAVDYLVFNIVEYFLNPIDDLMGIAQSILKLMFECSSNTSRDVTSNVVRGKFQI